MSIKLVPVTCPACGATLSVEEGRRQIFCSYCGIQVLLNNENEYVYRHIDEAGVRQAETEQMVRMRELDLVDKREEQKKIYIFLWLAITGGLLFLGIIGLMLESTGLFACFLIALCSGIFGAKFLMKDQNKPDEKRQQPSPVNNYAPPSPNPQMFGYAPRPVYPGNHYVTYTSDKSKATALLLCLFLGMFGIHYFYVGRIIRGLLYLCTCGFFGIGWIVDIIVIASGGFRDNTGAPLRR